jgi:hypothetical protein
MKLLLVGMFWKDETGRAKAWWSCFSLLGDFTSLKGKCDGGEHTNLWNWFDCWYVHCYSQVEMASQDWEDRSGTNGSTSANIYSQIFRCVVATGSMSGKRRCSEACTGCMGAMCIPAILARFVLTPFFCSLSLNELYMGVNLGTSHS